MLCESLSLSWWNKENRVLILPMLARRRRYRRFPNPPREPAYRLSNSLAEIASTASTPLPTVVTTALSVQATRAA
jgi:hypothetical protein